MFFGWMSFYWLLVVAFLIGFFLKPKIVTIFSVMGGALIGWMVYQAFTTEGLGAVIVMSNTIQTLMCIVVMIVTCMLRSPEHRGQVFGFFRSLLR